MKEDKGSKAKAALSVQKDEAPKVEKVKKFRVRAVHGDMLDLTTNTWIPTQGVDLDEVNSFVQSQIDAKKMQVVEE